MNRPWIRHALVLAIFTLTFMALTVTSYVQKSATADEPINLTAGYTMLQLGDHRIHPENLPLLRMWAALPLLAMPNVKLDTNRVSWARDDRVRFAFEFLYKDNDADRLLYKARFMIVLLGVGLGCLIFLWAHEWFGFWPAVVVLGLYTTEPNILAHSRLVTMDVGVTFLMFGTLYFLWRLTQRYTAGNLLGLTAFFALALVSKSTSLLLVPLVGVLLGVRVWRDKSWAAAAKSRRARLFLALSTGAWLLAAAYFALWGVYGFRYLPKAGSAQPFRFTEHPLAKEQTPRLAAGIGWIDSHRLLPNACAQGFVLEQIHNATWPSYLGGNLSVHGWWYYFPIALLIKTPEPLLLLALAGLILCCARWDMFWERGIFVLFPLAAGMGVAMRATMDIGLRHILPLYPFLLLLGGYPVAAVLGSRLRSLKGLLAGLCLLQIVESAMIYPDYLAFFNLLVGGPRNGYKYLADSNIDWGQDLKALKHWMDANQIQQINLSYFGMADPAYYGIQCTYLPGSPFFGVPRKEGPILPGFVAVSVHNLTGANPGLPDHRLYQPLLRMNPVAELGHSIHVYWVDRPW